MLGRRRHCTTARRFLFVFIFFFFFFFYQTSSEPCIMYTHTHAHTKFDFSTSPHALSAVFADPCTHIPAIHDTCNTHNMTYTHGERDGGREKYSEESDKFLDGLGSRIPNRPNLLENSPRGGRGGAIRGTITRSSVIGLNRGGQRFESDYHRRIIDRRPRQVGRPRKEFTS